MSSSEHIRADFIAMVRRPEAAIDLARTALLVAAESDPGVDIEGQAGLLDAWAAELRGRLDPQWNNLQKLARLRSFVYEELGFRGDQSDYYSPSNSLLHEVLQRRRGIPLTLAIVMMEVGWRVGIPFEGVGFPGHFLVRLTGEPRDLLLDPYQHAMSVHEEDCRRMLLHTTGGKLPFEQGLIASVGKRAMIARLLHTLKGAYLRSGDDRLALTAVDRLLVLDPEDLDERRDRGLLLFRLGRWRESLPCLVGYLERAPLSGDREEISQHVAALRQLIASLN
ncbi:MAG: tetratricopeptide repeat protein [Candidatus Eisenbacteria bacterium]|nr:tetratricopeptide repeat protein [Candidatus Eisenbacteria bacterium]